MNSPRILAPAGDKNSFLAAIAAGADAVYCGLKIFSARMEAGNFSVDELAGLTRLARARNVEVYIAFNSIIKESELDKAFRLIDKLVRHTEVDALIVQDPALVALARKAGFTRALHLSTLGNCTFPKGLNAAGQLGFSKIVLPREFTIDEIKMMAANCPQDVELEVFIHGALCYSVSGRCYWSSWFGGKSALRGRCVQPCRRLYDQKGQKNRYFSCKDFSADVLAKVLKDTPKITTWKIEGRKKGPHYVYYTVRAYRLLRDDPKRKKEALACLDYAMGREFTHYNLLSQRRMNPLDHASETGSGLFAGRIKNPSSPYLITREALFPDDLLRIGYEDDKFHSIQKVTRAVPKKGKFFLGRLPGPRVPKGAPVYIIDRRTPEVMTAIRELETELEQIDTPKIRPAQKPAIRSAVPGKQGRQSVLYMDLSRGRGRNADSSNQPAVWISARNYAVAPSPRNWLWLDPLIFPPEEKQCQDYIDAALKKGAKNFVLNAPWQISLFQRAKKLNLWAGPYCNVTNSMTVTVLKQQGFSGVIVSPELDQETFLTLPANSELPLGVVVRGNWPLGVSRILSDDLKPGQAFVSPMGEMAWASKQNSNYYIFPNWHLDLTSKEDLLKKAGYSLFVHIQETLPKGIKLKNRPGLWNWNLKLL